MIYVQQNLLHVFLVASTQIVALFKTQFIQLPSNDIIRTQSCRLLKVCHYYCLFRS